MIFNMSGGGGGASLNFKIVSYATEEALLAATPAENTIGVITEREIASWTFSPSEPAEPVEGMLWIVTGTSGAVEFNALKKNSIPIRIISAKQYVSDEWNFIIAYIYKSNQWIQFSNESFVIYESGTQNVQLATFATEDHGYSASASDLVNRGSVEFGPSNMSMTIPGSTQSGSSCQFIGTQAPVDVSEYSKLVVELSNLYVNDRESKNHFIVTASPEKSYPGTVAGSASQTIYSSDGVRTVEVDISAMSGNAYIVLTGVEYWSANSITAVIDKISLR